jgi:hypothetical protein
MAAGGGYERTVQRDRTKVYPACRRIIVQDLIQSTKLVARNSRVMAPSHTLAMRPFSSGVLAEDGVGSSNSLPRSVTSHKPPLVHSFPSFLRHRSVDALHQGPSNAAQRFANRIGGAPDVLSELLERHSRLIAAADQRPVDFR